LWARWSSHRLLEERGNCGDIREESGRLQPVRLNVLRRREGVSFTEGVEFSDRDISKDPEALQELTGVHHVFTTPAITVDDELVVGFDQERLEELLAKPGV
jgi:glutaredoxin